MVEILDEDSALRWLKAQKPLTKTLFASRCALRVLPALGAWEDATTRGLAFSSCRAVFISAVAASSFSANIGELRTAARAARMLAATHARAFENSGIAQDCVIAAAKAITAAANAATTARTMHASRSLTYSAEAEVYLQNSSNASAATSFMAPLTTSLTAPLSTLSDYADSAVFSAAASDTNAPDSWAKLWPDGQPPDGIAAAWEGLKAQWKVDGANWSFWIEWYEGILKGTPLPWDLTQRIAAEVTEEQWDAGQVVVAERIKTIRLQFDLGQEVVKLKEQLAQQHPDPAHDRKPTIHRPWMMTLTSHPRSLLNSGRK